MIDGGQTSAPVLTFIDYHAPFDQSLMKVGKVGKKTPENEVDLAGVQYREPLSLMLSLRLRAG